MTVTEVLILHNNSKEVAGDMDVDKDVSYIKSLSQKFVSIWR